MTGAGGAGAIGEAAIGFGALLSADPKVLPRGVSITFRSGLDADLGASI